MKRNLIFIILVIMFFCLTGCNKEKEIDKDLEEDIKILSKLGIEGSESGEKGEQILSHFINVVRLLPEHFTFYTGKIDYSKTYVMCAYIEKEKAVSHYHRFTVPNYYDDVTWVKYEKEEDIKVKHKGLILTDTFLVYSITIYKDILSNKEYNQTYKLHYNTYYRDTYHEQIQKIVNSEGDYIFLNYKNLENFNNFYFDRNTYFDSQPLLYEDDVPYVIFNDKELNSYFNDFKDEITKVDLIYRSSKGTQNIAQSRVTLNQFCNVLNKKLIDESETMAEMIKEKFFDDNTSLEEIKKEIDKMINQRKNKYNRKRYRCI